MPIHEKNKVHLDHLIARQSIRYIKPISDNTKYQSRAIPRTDPNIRYNDIKGDWFSNIKKPDFQRETNAWIIEQCIEFLDSVVHGRIVPSIILWRNEENGSIYVLDGAHRLSVIRAWMTDDWGDRRIEYYERKDKSSILRIARDTRIRVQKKIGSFADFEKAYLKMQEHIKKGDEAPKKLMESRDFLQATFFSDTVSGNQTLVAQWEHGDYDSAEQSFLRINRQGTPLHPWEAYLIEYRRSSYSRTIMAIANSAEKGHYWPEQNIDKDFIDIIKEMPSRCSELHDKLFVPFFKHPVKDLSVPMMVAPAYFQKHQYLLEIIPLIAFQEIALNVEKQIELLNRDFNADAKEVIRNAKEIVDKFDEGLSHISYDANNPKSLAIVPLFYWYNNRGQYNRGLLYGFVHWLLSGSESEVFYRKLIFSSVREKFEKIFFYFKPQIAQGLILKSGAGLKAVRKTSQFIQDLILYLQSPESEDSEESFEKILNKLLNSPRKTRKGKRRIASNLDKTQVNIGELFETAIKCHICGGAVYLKGKGIQYDHIEDYSRIKMTNPENLRPTHPFCNNNKKRIVALKEKVSDIELPKYKIESTPKKSKESKSQLSFFDEDSFPS